MFDDKYEAATQTSSSSSSSLSSSSSSYLFSKQKQPITTDKWQMTKDKYNLKSARKAYAH